VVEPEVSSSNSSAQRKLTRSREHFVFGGVCGGLAEYFGWRPYTMRLLFVLSCVLPGPQILAYFILWFVIPNAPRRR
jgi:phage shock protein C